MAEATIQISHPKLVNTLSHSELMNFPDKIQCMAEKGTFCPFQCLHSNFGTQLLPQCFCKSEAFPVIASTLEHPLWIYSRIYFILAENIYTKTWKSLLSLVSKHLKAHLQGKWVMQCHTIIKKSYICKSLGTFEKFCPFQPPLTSQNFRNNCG